MARDVYQGKGITRRDFLKLVGAGAAGAFTSKFLPESSYAALIKDLAVFDFDVSSPEYSDGDRKKGREIADKLAHCLIRNLGDVRVFRMRGYINLGEVPESIGADGCIEGTLSLDSGNVAIYAKYGDLHTIDIGNKSYNLRTRESELDGAVLDLSNRISKDLGGGNYIKNRNFEIGPVPENFDKDAVRKLREEISKPRRTN